MTSQSQRRSIFSRLPSTLLAAAALTAVSLLLLGYQAVGAHRLGLLDLQALWRNDGGLLTSAIGWHALMGSFDRGLQALLPGQSFMPGIVILTLVCWLAWGYAALFILRQASHAQVGRDSLAWLGVLFVLPATAIMVPLLYVQWAPVGQAAGNGGFLGALADMIAVAVVVFLASILLLPRRISLGVVAGQALTWGLLYALALWGLKVIGVQALGPLPMLVLVLFLLSLVFMLALQRATDELASLEDLGASQALEYALMLLAGLAASKDKIAASDLSASAGVPQAEADEVLRRLKDASLARMTQGRWAGVWPAERIEVRAVASALGFSGQVAATSNTPLVQEAHSLGWQGVSLADLAATPSESVHKASQEPHTLEAIDAKSAAAMPLAPHHSANETQATASALSPFPAKSDHVSDEHHQTQAVSDHHDVQTDAHEAHHGVHGGAHGGTQHEAHHLPQQHAQHETSEPETADPVAAALHSSGHRMVRSFEAEPAHQVSPQNRALSLALGRAAGQNQQGGQSQQGAKGQQGGILGVGDYDVMVSGHSPWRDGDQPQQEAPEPNDDAVTLDAIRREIQALMDDQD